ncbi:hypothetical protein AXF42_Ash017835 [Apostasia shenzhenica]|uniref:Uncharacterized protein n=1 Tax=Apostasia shenzhenica TaxID=1088818 RepID=A0A2I0A3W8_9ASPA|nr:hypothetical protein AXF42_Ash017835 [Apostasia shenzhenica]
MIISTPTRFFVLMASGFLLWISCLALILFLLSAAVASEPANPFAPSGRVPADLMAGMREMLEDNWENPGIGPVVVSVVNSARARKWTEKFNGGNMPVSELFVFRRLVYVRKAEEGGGANHIDYTIAVGEGTLKVRMRRLGTTIDFLKWRYVGPTR